MPKNMLSAASDRYWFGRGQHLMVDGPDARLLANEAFRAGARWSLAETTRISPYVNQFIEMLILLGVFDGEIDMVPTPSDGTASGQASACDGDLPALST